MVALVMSPRLSNVWAFILWLFEGPSVFAVGVGADGQRDGCAAPLVIPNLHDLRHRVDAQIGRHKDVEGDAVRVEPGKLGQRVGEVPLVRAVPAEPDQVKLVIVSTTLSETENTTSPSVPICIYIPPRIKPSPLNTGR